MLRGVKYVALILSLAGILSSKSAYAYYEEDTPDTFNATDARIAFAIGSILNDGDPLTKEAINSFGLAFFGQSFTDAQLGEILDGTGEIDVDRATLITDFDESGVTNILDARIGFAVGQLDPDERTVDNINDTLLAFFGSGSIPDGAFIPGSGQYPGASTSLVLVLEGIPAGGGGPRNFLLPGDTLRARIIATKDDGIEGGTITGSLTLAFTSPDFSISPTPIAFSGNNSVLNCPVGNTVCRGTITQKIDVDVPEGSTGSVTVTVNGAGFGIRRTATATIQLLTAPPSE